jgi:hypothetical protein
MFSGYEERMAIEKEINETERQTKRNKQNRTDDLKN